jgi:hypothetical protein
MLAQQGHALDWFGLATTLLATLVGGVLAIGTSVVLKRWELRQTTRVRMFDELLPEVARSYFGWLDSHRDDTGARVSQEAVDAATRLYRAAVISGRKEKDIVSPIRERMRERSTVVDLEQAHRIDRDINRKFDELEGYLAVKIR